jgi:hypothetical protein
MPDRLAFAKRLEELKQEHETGLDRLKQLEKQADDLRKTLERISGAIQVLEEILAENNS